MARDIVDAVHRCLAQAGASVSSVKWDVPAAGGAAVVSHSE